MIVVYVDGSEDWLKDLLLALSVELFSIVFMLIIFLEALHFVYRYLLFCRFEWQFLLTIRTLLKFLLVAYPSYIILHFLNFIFLTTADEDVRYAAGFTNRYIHAVSFLFVDYKTGQNRWKSVVPVILITLNNAILIGTIIFCGLKIYFNIKKLTGQRSSITVETHKTLFHMIVIQTIVPFFLLHMPVAVTFFLPIFTEVEGETNIILLYLMFYPIIEPLIVIFFLLKGQFKRVLCIRSLVSSASSFGT